MVLRTTFLVGHPGETGEAFQSLCAFVREARPERLGVFTFSKEEGTVSALLPERVPAATAKKRRTALMRIARTISKEQQHALVGKELEVLVEGPSAEGELVMQGRWAGQAPEIDGVVYLGNALPDDQAPPQAGDLVRVLVTRTADYDLAADVIAVIERAPARAPAAPARPRLPVLVSH